MSKDVYVDARLIFSKNRLKVRTSDGSIIPFNIDVFECGNPYIMFFVLKSMHGHTMTRMDVNKNDLAKELRLWLEGKIIRNPVVVVSTRVDGAMREFIKFGKTPKQDDLILWIMSRSEIQWGAEPTFCFGGFPFQSYDESNTIDNFPKSVEAAYSRLNYDSKSNHPVVASRFLDSSLLFGDTSETRKLQTQQELLQSPSRSYAAIIKDRDITPMKQFNPNKANKAEIDTFHILCKLLGKTEALQQMTQNQSNSYEREDFKTNLSPKRSMVNRSNRIVGTTPDEKEMRRRSLKAANVSIVPF